ncbi:MAG TPA: NAD-binding protein [Thermodesulfobacteriota bacterium]|nr:NAD-binding protein [Thermodesulfobacteriota bacterium]
MSSYLIIGCGHFGSQAVLKLLQKDLHARITVVDQDRTHLEKISKLPIETIVSNGRIFLDQFPSQTGSVDYIVPAVPYHLAFEFILSRLKPLGARRTKIPLLEELPNPMMGKTGDLYTSLASFLCPEDCPEPAQYCTATGEKRAKPLFKMLMNLKGPFDPVVIRSQQLGLGVGGYRPQVLTNLIETIKKRRGLNRPFLISTACRCHGVISALSF